MIQEVDTFTKAFLEHAKNKPIRLISHFDTDGITSAAIIIKTLQRLDKKLTVRIVKGLDENILMEELKRQPQEILLFTDLASGSLEYFTNLSEPIYIIDHHEIHADGLNENINIINPHLTEDPDGNTATGAGLCYLFSKTISEDNKDLAKLAIIGLIGDRHEVKPTNCARDKRLNHKKRVNPLPRNPPIKKSS